MDLAKIRKKGVEAAEAARETIFTPQLQDTKAVTPDLSLHQPPVPTTESGLIPLAVTENPAPLIIPQAIIDRSAMLMEAQFPPPPPAKDPIAAILAGRKASGCDEEAELALVDSSEETAPDYTEFLCFRVADEVYGINIMEIKEIIRPRETTEVPRSPSFVTGIISLRGVIIPIIDMRERLGLQRENLSGKERVIVVKRSDGFTGLFVDSIVQVIRIQTASLEPAPAVLDGIDRDFVSGIGKANGMMIIILTTESIADINLF